MAMACRFEVILRGDDPERVQRAAEAALDEIDRIETLLNMYDPDSTVSAINRSAAKEPVPVNDEVFDLLLVAGAIWEKTDGAFDPTAGPLVRLWRKWRARGMTPDPSVIDSVRQRVGMQHVILNPKRRTIRFNRPGMHLDLGAIGKGYAVDRAVEVLEGYGYGHFLLHGGTSSAAARGNVDKDHDGWPIGLTDPADRDRVLETRTLRDQALGCSNQQSQHYECGGHIFGHVLDPRTGWPVPADSGSVVICDSAAWADALSTALFILGPDGGDVVARACPNARFFFLPVSHTQRPPTTEN